MNVRGFSTWYTGTCSSQISHTHHQVYTHKFGNVSKQKKKEKKEKGTSQSKLISRLYIKEEILRKDLFLQVQVGNG